tara:strand:- start:198 stop:386 length:189 start_codon:yes stop_codon:yes gene_type:complete
MNMDKYIDNEKNTDYSEIFTNNKSLNSKVDQEILFITTDNWLAQLGARRNDELFVFKKGNNI